VFHYSNVSNSLIHTATKWREPQKYSFHIDLSIEVDASFIERQGSAEKAVEYINFLVSASNFVFEHEVDAHCKCKTFL
jgi:hypothetical protein